MGKIFQTHGSLYLKKKGVIETSTLHVGNAFIEGKINGDLNAMGTVKILKRGEVYGKITCRRLFVEKGGIFFGSVQMLN
ncbi:MAG: polymer-forming cytoskeletal protein [Candidatus Brocadiaceae bacterium]|nr:polymer-forming cytoskeletal protein [Candidatus Brocadiaceae bacterium]